MDGRYSNSELSLVNSISISKSQLQILQNHAQESEPNESSAILYGQVKDHIITVEDIFLTKNKEQTPISFTISEENLLLAYQKETIQSKIVSIFHSHPNSEAYPSNTDKKFMQTNPFVWVIYSGIDKNFKAFVLENDVKEIQIT